MESVGFPFSVSRNFIQLCIHTHSYVDTDFSLTKSFKAPSRGSVWQWCEHINWIYAYMCENYANSKTVLRNWFYFIWAHGRILSFWGCSSVYINLPPSYIFQSPLFQPRCDLRTTEGVDGGSLLTFILTFPPLDFFYFYFYSSSGFYSPGAKWTNFRCWQG